MFLLLSFSQHTKSFNYKCESPLVHPPPVSGYKLRSLSLVTRHGHRTPFLKWEHPERVGYWTCTSDTSYSPKMYSTNSNGIKRRYENTHNDDTLIYPPSCGVGELTLNGMRQHFELGKFYRKYLVDEIGLLPVHLDASLINLRSSHVERCIKSMQSFMSGFYPPEKPGERLNITTASSSREPLAPSENQCDEMAKMRKEWMESDDFNKRMQSAKEKYGFIFDSLKIKMDNQNWMWIGDLITAYYCSGLDLPINMTEEVFQETVKNFGYSVWGFYNQKKGVASGSVWRVIFRDLDRVASNNAKEKFFYYSAHDTTVAAMLNSLGYSQDEMPPFRSHCTVEMWEKKGKETEVRVVFNGKVIPLGESKSETMKYSAFKTMLAEYANKACINELP